MALAWAGGLLLVLGAVLTLRAFSARNRSRYGISSPWSRNRIFLVSLKNNPKTADIPAPSLGEKLNRQRLKFLVGRWWHPVMRNQPMGTKIHLTGQAAASTRPEPGWEFSLTPMNRALRPGLAAMSVGLLCFIGLIGQTAGRADANMPLNAGTDRDGGHTMTSALPLYVLPSLPTDCPPTMQITDCPLGTGLEASGGLLAALGTPNPHPFYMPGGSGHTNSPTAHTNTSHSNGGHQNNPPVHTNQNHTNSPPTHTNTT